VFLDQVSSEILAWSGEGLTKHITRFASLSQWEQAYRSERLTRTKSPPPATPAGSAPRAGKKKLSYKDQRELDGIEGVIQETEEKLRKVTEESARPEIQSDAKKLTELSAQMGALQAEVERLYMRWSELEG
jgi:ATP-binding cassette subfamily F protein uup